MLFHFTAQVLAQPIIAQLPERAGWGTPVILALRRQRQEDLGFKSCNNEEIICEGGGGGESVGFPYAKETIALIGSIFPSHPPSLPLSLWCFLFYISHLFCWNKVVIYEQPKKLTHALRYTVIMVDYSTAGTGWSWPHYVHSLETQRDGCECLACLLLYIPWSRQSRYAWSIVFHLS